ncbi:MAG: hypothetical protein FWC24_02710, partial [Treponema sp.]|nr:hypothetical protein [Treponema sp.]
MLSDMDFELNENLPADENAEENVDEELDDDASGVDGNKVDLNDEKFPEITKRFEPVPHKFFDDPEYYKIALAGEGDISQRVHAIMQKYFNAKDPKDRSVFRTQLASAYWEFLRSVARKSSGKIPMAKRFLLRFNVLHHNFIDADSKALLSKLVIENELDQPVYYVDEWLKAVGTGTIRASTTDEVKVSRSNTQVKMKQLLDKAAGRRDGALALLRAKDHERTGFEKALMSSINIITEHFPLDGFADINACYTEPQKRAVTDVQEVLKNLLRSDREFAVSIKDFYQTQADVQILKDKMEGVEEEALVDFQAIDSEFDTIRQAAKMTVGRQG